MDTVQLIKDYRLLIRPSLLFGRWIAGRFKGVTADGKSYADTETIAEADTLEDAVLLAVEKIERMEHYEPS